MSDVKTEQIVSRGFKLRRERPAPVRDLRTSDAMLAWTLPPIQSARHTHIRVRFNRDDGDPIFELGPNQTRCSIPKTGEYFVSAWNEHTQLESEKVHRAASAGGGGSGTGANTTVYDTLSAPTTVIASPGTPATGETLVYELTQDATGGRQITWDSDFDPSVPIGLNYAANAVTVFFFYGNSGLWYLLSNPVWR